MSGSSTSLVRIMSGMSSNLVKSCLACAQIRSNLVRLEYKSGQIVSGVSSSLVKSCLCGFKSGQILSGVSTSGQILSGVCSSLIKSCLACDQVWSNVVWREFKSGQILSGVC